MRLPNLSMDSLVEDVDTNLVEDVIVNVILGNGSHAFMFYQIYRE